VLNFKTHGDPQIVLKRHWLFDPPHTQLTKSKQRNRCTLQ